MLGGGEGEHNYFLAQNHEQLQQGWGLLMGGHEKRINYDIYYVKGFSERVGMKNGSIMILYLFCLTFGFYLVNFISQINVTISVSKVGGHER